MAKSNLRKRSKKMLVFGVFFLGLISCLAGQDNKSYAIRGRLIDSLNQEPLIFATIAVRRTSGTTFITGCSAGPEGYFETGSLQQGNYELQISALGYETETRVVDLKQDTDLGNIMLDQRIALLEEVTVAGERIKARQDAGITTYFMNEKIYRISNTGTDLLGYIPGIQIDLMKNISLNGNSGIMVLIDGRERDKNFINQLAPEKIDRVEIINVPSSRYDETVTGVINIILKEKTAEKVSGHFLADIPVFKSFVYSFPDFSADFRIRNLGFNVSYSGAFSYFDITESGFKKTETGPDVREMTSLQLVRQKDKSHSFHFGVDYRLNKHNEFSFYSFTNPFSREFDGDVEYQFSGMTTGEKLLKYSKNDTDRNLNSHFSLWYRHGSDKPGKELTAEINYSNFRACNGTKYISAHPGNEYSDEYSSLIRPLQNSFSFRLDYALPLSAGLKFDAGFKIRTQKMQDRMSDGFTYGENILAAYWSLAKKGLKYTVTGGMRAERSATGSGSRTVFSGITILPQLSVTRNLTEKQTLELSYNSTAYRPNIYELNPYTSFIDPLSVGTGNSELESEITHRVRLSWSRSSGNNFISPGVFHELENRSINRYAIVLDDGKVESLIANLGTISKTGVQFSGSVRINNLITVNPWFRVYNMHNSLNETARLNNMAVRHKMVVETSFSAIASFKNDLALSFQFQYKSPVIDMQSDFFSDPLWMISAEKSFLKKFKAGIVTALPFTRSFTWQGYKTKAGSLEMHNQGDLKLPVFPFWLKFSYKFNSGEKNRQSTGSREDIIKIPEKGF